jgi:Xaa-Pro dipeptidase
MTEQKIGAIVLETGTSMSYFVNFRWGLSERPFLTVIPARGEIAYISPGFEEERARELIQFSTPDGPKWFTQPSPAIDQPFA